MKRRNYGRDTGLTLRMLFTTGLLGLLLLIASYVIQYAADRQLAQRFRIPAWYLRLRTGLTSVAVLCLGLALVHLARA
jgi:hypothetical protein